MIIDFLKKSDLMVEKNILKLEEIWKNHFSTILRKIFCTVNFLKLLDFRKSCKYSAVLLETKQSLNSFKDPRLQVLFMCLHFLKLNASFIISSSYKDGNK